MPSGPRKPLTASPLRWLSIADWLGTMTEVQTHGMGQVERMADQAGLHVSYTHRAKDRTNATSALTARIGTVESALTREGVQVRDRRLAVHDVWDGKRRSGAQATQSYQLRITDLAVLNDLIGDLMVTEPATLRGPFWELANPGEAERDAQRDAVRAARRRAEVYAEELGCQLGRLVTIADSGVHAHPLRGAAVAMPMAAAGVGRPDIAQLSLEPQLVTVTATCTMTWEIGQSDGP